MIVSVQFDLSLPKDAELFALVTSQQHPLVTRDLEAVSNEKDEDPRIEFPPKIEVPGPTISEVQSLFKKCQDKDAVAAKDFMRGFLTHHGAKAVKDLSDDQRIVLKADLDGFLNG